MPEAAVYCRKFAQPFRLGKKPTRPQSKRSPGPVLMPQYHNAAAEQSVSLNLEAAEVFEQGTQDRERADQYVRLTVFLAIATVLLLAAISQRFRTSRIGAGLVLLAFLILLVSCGAS
jgi:hypothetical protein